MTAGTKRAVGFAGLGRLGRPIARNVMQAGFPLTVWNRDSSKATEFTDAGAQSAATPRELAERCEIVLTSLADPSAVDAVYEGPDGLFAGAKSGAIFIDLSTVSPETSRKHAATASQHGIQYLDAPVAGSVAAAADRKLAIMVGGDRSAYDACGDLFAAIGQASYYMGPSGSGSTMKLVSNTILATIVQALAEALALGEKAGLDRATMMEVISASSAGAPVVKGKASAITERDFLPATFTVQLMKKDLWLALSMANDLAVPMPATAVAHDMVNAANATGRHDHDFTAIALLMEELAGLPTSNSGKRS